MASSSEHDAWNLDQLSKSEFFHQKLHEWGVLEVAYQIEQVKGELLTWNLKKLGISQSAWDKIIHRGIKPIIVFAHPDILIQVSRSVGYYRMLAMVSQKSMNRIGLRGVRYEQGRAISNEQIAITIASHLNNIMNHLIESEEHIDAREFDLWRGMAAGSQAQGSWQNTKGTRIEIIIKGILQRRLYDKNLVSDEISGGSRLRLVDGRTVVFADEPDVGIYTGDEIVVAIEIKGGIDVAGVLERIGAAIKSLSRAKDENPRSITVLILQGVSVTQQARDDLRNNQHSINYWFTVEEVLESGQRRDDLFRLLSI